MGDGIKRVRFLDELEENIERRRSSRIIALEEKKQQEKERKVVLALAKNKSSTNQMDDRRKGKEKIDGRDQMDDFISEDMKHGSSKNGHKRKAFDQLISSIQEGRHINNTTTSGANVSSLINVPERHILELAIDFLQRKDEENLFQEPINPDMVENYNKLVKEPMDFGTIRAKIHENLYTKLEEFKRDVYLLCCNAMNVFPETSRYYKVAEIIGLHALRIFKDLGVESEHFNLDFSLDKKLPSRRPQDKQLGTSLLERFSPKLAGENNVTPSAVPERQKRHTYWAPCKKPMVSEFLDVNKPNIQVKKDLINYKDSLLRFVKDLGPTAQRVARKKLAALKFENVLTTPQQQTQPNTLSSAQILSLALPFLNKPLAIPGTSTQQNKNLNTMIRSFNIMDDTNYKGKRIVTNDNWHASAAILLSSNFISNNKGKSKIGFESSNAKGTMDISGSSTSAHTHVHPTCVVLAPQPLDSIAGKLLLEQFPLSQPSPVAFNEPGPSFNVPSSVSLLSQLKGDECIPKQNLSEVTIFPSLETNTSLCGFGDFQAQMASQDFNNNPYPKHVNGQVNLLNPVPMHEPKSSSSLEIILGGGLVAPMDLPEDTNLALQL